MLSVHFLFNFFFLWFRHSSYGTLRAGRRGIASPEPQTTAFETFIEKSMPHQQFQLRYIGMGTVAWGAPGLRAACRFFSSFIIQGPLSFRRNLIILSHLLFTCWHVGSIFSEIANANHIFGRYRRHL